jgi:hypothetical protein
MDWRDLNFNESAFYMSEDDYNKWMAVLDERITKAGGGLAALRWQIMKWDLEDCRKGIMSTHYIGRIRHDRIDIKPPEASKHYRGSVNPQFGTGVRG